MKGSLLFAGTSMEWDAAPYSFYYKTYFSFLTIQGMEYKTCSNPDHAEALPATTEYFYIDRKAKDGLTSRCRDCLKANQRKYYQQHKEERLVYQRRYDQEHAEQISRWKEANSERLHEYRREYYRRHRARLLPRWREYSRGHRERVKRFSEKL